MNEIRAEKIEALQAVQEYVMKLIPAIKTVIEELQIEKKEDTDEFMKQCLEGLNWVIEVYNRTADVVNEKQTWIEKEAVNDSILALNEAKSEGDDEKIAVCLATGVIPFLEEMNNAVKSITA